MTQHSPIEALGTGLRLPLIGAPMFLASGVDLVVAQCCAGVIGTFPALNARPQEKLDEWLTEIKGRLGEHDAAHPERKAAPFGCMHLNKLNL